MNIGDELRVSQKRAQSVGEELANTISHGIGLCAALIGAPILLLEAHRSGAGFFFGTVIFAVTMSMLYLGSTLYHAWPQTRGKSILQVLDQSAIFLLIAGTYTPFTLGLLRGFWSATILVLFFVNQRLRYSHFIWHLFVLAGTSCHFLALLSCCAT